MAFDDQVDFGIPQIQSDLKMLRAEMYELSGGLADLRGRITEVVGALQERLRAQENREVPSERKLAVLQEFAMQNSSALANVPMRRLFPMVLYLPDVTEDDEDAQERYSRLARVMLAEFGMDGAFEFPYVFGGSGILTIFGTSQEPSVFDDFWKNHPGLDVVTTMIHRLGGAGGVVALVGLLYFGPTGKPKAISPEATKQIVYVVAQAKDANQGKVLLEDGLKRTRTHRKYLSTKIQLHKQNNLESKHRHGHEQ